MAAIIPGYRVSTNVRLNSRGRATIVDVDGRPIIDGRPVIYRFSVVGISSVVIVGIVSVIAVVESVVIPVIAVIGSVVIPIVPVVISEISRVVICVAGPWPSIRSARCVGMSGSIAVVRMPGIGRAARPSIIGSAVATRSAGIV